jgi:hypothetical protein
MPALQRAAKWRRHLKMAIALRHAVLIEKWI